MTINFSEQQNVPERLGEQVRAILGVPEEYLSNSVISSPVFLKQAERYINKQIASYEEKNEELEPEIPIPPENNDNDEILDAELNKDKDITNPTQELTYSEEDSTTIMLLKIAYIYYVCYLLCLGMYSRLPKQMENVNTKTILLSINWNQMAEDMLKKCDELIDEAIEELGEEVDDGNTFAVLSDSSEYPNTLI